MSGEPFKHCKVVLVGSRNVGKTSIATRYVHNTFKDEKVETIGAAHMTKMIQLDGKPVLIDIWDTAGEEKYMSIAPIYYRNAHIALIVFDLTRPTSASETRFWLKQLTTHASDQLFTVLVGNKLDLNDDRAVNFDEASKLASSFGCSYFEASAKTGNNVCSLFEYCIQHTILSTR